ncbi:MAG: hypothetical protein J7J86_04630 [Bacteroidales bacterium]|nr:hypothetical protein [Bacteroidales bacterium]
MRKVILVIILCGFSSYIFSQHKANKKLDKSNCITLGILQGGGSIFGVDFETLLSKQFGVQVGVGVVGFGAGLNYHFKPSIRSSFISLQYFHQGLWNSFTQSVIGSSLVYRGKKWFTFQIGLGAPIDRGPALPYDFEQPPVILLYSIGAYIPVR